MTIINPYSLNIWMKSFGAIEKVLGHLYFITGSFEQDLFDFCDITVSRVPIRIITATYTNHIAET